MGKRRNLRDLFDSVRPEIKVEKEEERGEIGLNYLPVLPEKRESYHQDFYMPSVGELPVVAPQFNYEPIDTFRLPEPYQPKIGGTLGVWDNRDRIEDYLPVIQENVFPSLPVCTASRISSLTSSRSSSRPRAIELHRRRKTSLLGGLIDVEEEETVRVEF